MNSTDIQRIEGKLDDLTEAVTKLVLFEERQTVQAAAIAELSSRVTASEKKLDSWINRGIGVWAVVASALTIYTAVKGH